MHIDQRLPHRACRVTYGSSVPGARSQTLDSQVQRATAWPPTWR